MANKTLENSNCNEIKDFQKMCLGMYMSSILQNCPPQWKFFLLLEFSKPYQAVSQIQKTYLKAETFGMRTGIVLQLAPRHSFAGSFYNTLKLLVFGRSLFGIKPRLSTPGLSLININTHCFRSFVYSWRNQTYRTIFKDLLRDLSLPHTPLFW